MSNTKSLGAGAAAVGFFGLLGCGASGGDGLVLPSIQLVDRTTQALGAVGTFIAAHGAYGAGCGYHSTTGKWSVPIGSFAGIDENVRLAVKTGDTACTLTLESLESSAGSARKVFTGQPVLALTETSTAGAKFSYMGNPAEFYATARLRSSSGALFSSNFFVDVVYSDDPTRVLRDTPSQYVSVTSTTMASNVPAPSYAINTASVNIQADAQKQVDTSSGSVQLTAGTQSGRSYVITQADPGNTLASIQTVYNAATPVTIAGSPVTITLAALGLNVGTQLPRNPYVIVANYDDAAPNTRSYQVFGLQFMSP